MDKCNYCLYRGEDDILEGEQGEDDHHEEEHADEADEKSPGMYEAATLYRGNKLRDGRYIVFPLASVSLSQSRVYSIT